MILMKLFREYQQASLVMTADDALEAALGRAIERYRITHVLESGTAEGTGSTQMIAKCFGERTPEAFVTIEANWERWRTARRNLARWPFIKCIWGQTVPVNEAVDFIAHDEAILHHERYPDLFIDDVDDPVGFYTAECRGERQRSSWLTLAEYVDRMFRHSGDRVLGQWLERMKEKRPLVVLDSAGGIGVLEYRIVIEQLGGAPYFLLLDDVHHLKHFRSLQDIKHQPSFSILGESAEHGWVLAAHRDERANK